jgi:hypothetical protein
MMHALVGDCDAEPSKCVVEQIERAFRDAMNGTIVAAVLRDLYPPDGLGLGDISDVNILPTGIDLVVNPGKCPPDWLERRARAEGTAAFFGFQLPPFRTVDFESDLLPARYEGYAGYCSLGRASL